METLSPDAFRERQLLRSGAWIVAFLAEWCPFCRQFLPEFETLEGGNSFRTAIADVTLEESPWWDDFHIEVIPALAVFRDGALVLRMDSDPGIGLPPRALDIARAAALTPRQ
jgi:thioredoxin-like negative regulator of GroEL